MGETHESLGQDLEHYYDLHGRKHAVDQERNALLMRLSSLEAELSDVDTELEASRVAIIEKYGMYTSPSLIREQLEEWSRFGPLVAHKSFFKAFVIVNPERNEELNSGLRRETYDVRRLIVRPRSLELGGLTLESDETHDRFLINALLNNRLGINRRQIALNEVFRGGSTGTDQLSREAAQYRYAKSLARLKEEPLWQDAVLQSNSQTHKKFYYLRHDIVIEPVSTAISYDV